MSVKVYRFSWPPRRSTSTPSPAPLTRALLISLIVVYILQLLDEWLLRGQFLDYIILSREGIQLKRYWQWISYGWIHSFGLPFHLLFNAMSLWFVGKSLEPLIGARRFTIIYILSLLGAAITWYMLDSTPTSALAGASGALFGCLAAMSIYLPELRVFLLIPPVVAKIKTIIKCAVIFEICCILFDWLPGLAHSAHLGGAITGWLAARFLPLPPPSEWELLDP